MTDDELELEVKPCGPPGSFLPARVEAPKKYSPSIWGKQKRKAPGHTSVVLKNLPDNCTNAMVLELLAQAGLTGQCDFLYVPTDFRNFSAFGYAFVNFVCHEQAQLAITRLSALEFDGTALEATWCADHQGYAVHVRRYRNSPVMHASVPEAYKPMIFKNGVQQSFPAATKKIKEPRLRRGAPVERQ
jgi:RNA recognition motif-containing protein